MNLLIETEPGDMTDHCNSKTSHWRTFDLLTKFQSSFSLISGWLLGRWWNITRPIRGDVEGFNLAGLWQSMAEGLLNTRHMRSQVLGQLKQRRCWWWLEPSVGDRVLGYMQLQTCKCGTWTLRQAGGGWVVIVDSDKSSGGVTKVYNTNHNELAHFSLSHKVQSKKHSFHSQSDRCLSERGHLLRYQLSINVRSCSLLLSLHPFLICSEGGAKQWTSEDETTMSQQAKQKRAGVKTCLLLHNELDALAGTLPDSAEVQLHLCNNLLIQRATLKVCSTASQTLLYTNED